MSFDDALRAFDLHLRAERNLSVHTRRAYLSDVRQLAAHVDARGRPAAVTAGLLEILGEHCAPSALESIPVLVADFRRLYRGFPCHHVPWVPDACVPLDLQNMEIGATR